MEIIEKSILGAISLLLCLPIALASVSCGGDKDKAAFQGPVVAEVNGKAITDDDLRITIDLVYPPNQRHLYTTPKGKAQALQKLVIMEMFNQEGVAQGLGQDPRINKIVENYKRFLIFNTLMTRGIDAQRVNDFFQTNFVHVAVIFVAKTKNITDKKAAKLKEKAEGIRKRIVDGEEFAELAKKYSDHPSGQKGGDIGAITRSAIWEPALTDTAMDLTPENPLSEVKESPIGFYIVKLLHPAGRLPTELMTDVIRQSVYAYLISQNYATYAAQLQTQAKVDVHSEALESMRMGQPTGADNSFLPSITPPGIPGMDTVSTP